MGMHNNPRIVQDGLVLHLDAADKNSYPGTGTVWYDLSGNANHFNIVATAYNSSGKYMDFNGSYGCAKRSPDLSISNYSVTCLCWTRVLNSSGNWRTLLRGLSNGIDHQVIIQSGGWNIGMYDNVNATGFNSTGYSQQSLPGYGTSTWIMMHWRWQSISPYYQFSYNDTPSTIRGSITSQNARFKSGVCSIGAYNNENTTPSDASQFWGDIASIQLYNKVLSDAEILQNYNTQKSRFGLT